MTHSSKNSVPLRDKKGKRTGFTTGACSAAAAKAATSLLLKGFVGETVDIILPNKKSASFSLKKRHKEASKAFCSIIKDAGDDPDCTHGAELIAEVSLSKKEGITIWGGDGVAKVTKPGLGLEVGTDAINPIPRKNIMNMVNSVLREHDGGNDLGLSVTIHVPGGEKMAEKTINKRLGLMGGISILGTTGIVHAFSTAAWKASVIQEINVARSCGEKEITLTTGGRSEQYAMETYPHQEKHCFVQMGDFLGIALKACARAGIEKVNVFAMMGKLSKMATGTMQTHAAASQVDCAFLANLAQEAGADDALIKSIRHANTARHVLTLCREAGVESLPSVICKHVREHCLLHVKNAFTLDVVMVDFDGHVIGSTGLENPSF